MLQILEQELQFLMNEKAKILYFENIFLLVVPKRNLSIDFFVFFCSVMSVVKIYQFVNFYLVQFRGVFGFCNPMCFLGHSA